MFRRKPGKCQPKPAFDTSAFQSGYAAFPFVSHFRETARFILVVTYKLIGLFLACRTLPDRLVNKIRTRIWRSDAVRSRQIATKLIGLVL